MSEANLRIAAPSVLAQFGLTGCRLTHIASRHNDVFRVAAPSSKCFVLRIQNNLMTDAHARSQIQWLEAIAKHSDVTVPQPVRTTDNRPFTHVDIGGSHRRAVLLRWLPGRRARSRSERVFSAIAKMIAAMHAFSQTFRPRAGFTCRSLDDQYLFGARFFIRAAKHGYRFKKSDRQTAAKSEELVCRAMEELGRGVRRFGLIHADLGLQNIIFHRGRPSPIDFDEFGKSWFIFDLAELIRTSITPDNWRERKKLAIGAYTADRNLDSLEIEMFDAFIVATNVQYLNWAFAHARNCDDLKWVRFCIDVISAIARSHAV
jgi:Ser/Thr protein kinase RdoA (MazF antagonist)